MPTVYDSVLINTPVSSPLHPQANLPLLKGFLAAHGFQAKVIDSNIQFFHYLLGDLDTNEVRLNIDQCFENPIRILNYYNAIEKRLWEKSKQFEGFDISLRSVSLKYDRTRFDSVVASLGDRASNPFVAFYEGLIADQIMPLQPKIVGIAITFQDQIISAFTLASLLREKMPGTVIVMGGQIVTRCYNTMLGHAKLCSYFDYLALWDGENTMLDIHRRVIRGEDIPLVNIAAAGAATFTVDRKKNAPGVAEIPSPDFSDIEFDKYLYPEMLVPLQTTRGCYGTCEFCAIPFGSNYYRVRKVDEVIRDILTIQEQTQKRYGRKATYFKFMEDTSSPALLLALSREIVARKIDAKWETFARLEKAFTEPGVMKQLFEGGCRKVHWGLESNDPSVLKNMNKKTETSYSDQV
ncbi:MAG TPA: radical SAM protein, partial [Candidatus Omnitrophota bacterium]|nr:radical SAM protein [Candidatus Omnitrophota bacterium]